MSLNYNTLAKRVKLVQITYYINVRCNAFLQTNKDPVACGLDLGFWQDNHGRLISDSSLSNNYEALSDREY